VKYFSPQPLSPILVVDDEPDIVLTLQDLLEGEGYHVDVATNGIDALERVRGCSYGCVLLDIRLPDIDGLFVLDKMVKLVPGLPIIVLTACSNLDSVTGPLEEQGAFDCLHKPINRGEVRTAVRHARKAQDLATKNKQAQSALLASEQRFQAVFQTAQDAIVLANQQGRIVSWNPAAESMFGYTAEEIFGQSLTLIMPARYREAHLKGLARFQATGKAHVLGATVSLHGLRKNGQEFPIELSLNSWRNGSDSSFSGFIRDVSGREAGEKTVADGVESP